MKVESKVVQTNKQVAINTLEKDNLCYNILASTEHLRLQSENPV